MTTACANCLHRQPYHYRGEGECAFVNDEQDTCRCQRYRPPTQVPAPDATAGDGLRSAMAAIFWRHGVSHQQGVRSATDILALPALRDVLAAAARDAEKVRHVRSALDQWGDYLTTAQVRALRRALDGPS